MSNKALWKMETQHNSTYTQNQKKTIEISRTNKEATGLGEYDTHRTY